MFVQQSGVYLYSYSSGTIKLRLFFEKKEVTKGLELGSFELPVHTFYP